VTRTVARRSLFGALPALASMAVLTAAMLPLRSHLSIATTALVLVVPVVVGAVAGGFLAGVVSALSGFFVYLFFFIPPYLTLEVGAAENWTALGVYAVIMVPIARLVDNMITARAQANERGVRLHQLFEVSGLLVEDRPLEELLATIVTNVRDVVDARQVSILLPHDNQLEILASAGALLADDDRRQIRSLQGQLASLDTHEVRHGDLFGVALVAAGRSVGLLTISGPQISEEQLEPLRPFANQAALAIERAQLQQQALRDQLRLQRGLLPVPLIAQDGPVAVVSRYRPGREQAQLGGDFFDVVCTGDGRVWVVIGDVAGHGPDEAALGVCLRVGWRALVLAGHAPLNVLPALQELLVSERRDDETFTTVCMLVIDERTAGAAVFLAGHPAPLLMCDGRIDEIEVAAEPPLGVIAGARWSGQRVEFGEGSSLLCFTDGLIEGFNAAPARLGVDGLMRVLSLHASDTDTNYLVDALIAEVVARNGGALADDVALLHLRRRG
jgi:serine phosphatase RsbU (regulator of sigma subunit)